MESEIAQDRPITMAAGRVCARGWAEEIVRRDEGRAGSKMLAYGNLGRRIGRSNTWVRRLIRGDEVGLAHDTFERMRLAYLRHCERIDAEALDAAKRAATLKAQNDALEARLTRQPLGGD